jgi:hypothetical protein
MALTLDRIFYIYMAIVGLVAGVLLVKLAAIQEFWIPPFFWMLLAVGLFEVGNTFVPRDNRVVALTNISRGIGLAIGLVAMVAVTVYAGVTVRFI